MSDVEKPDSENTPEAAQKKTDSAEAAEVKAEQTPDEEIEAAIAQSKIKSGKKLQTKKYIKYGAITLGVLFLVWFINWLFKPYQGTMAYGICRVFTELTLQYPPTMQVSSVETFKSSVRLWYTYTDSFGEYRMEPVQCYYRADETMGMAIDKVTIRRREVDQEIIENFNKTIPAILQNPPDLALPYQPDSLESLNINPYLYMKPIF